MASYDVASDIWLALAFGATTIVGAKAAGRRVTEDDMIDELMERDYIQAGQCRLTPCSKCLVSGLEAKT
jgi:hypothetical protein